MPKNMIGEYLALVVTELARQDNVAVLRALTQVPSKLDQAIDMQLKAVESQTHARNANRLLQAYVQRLSEDIAQWGAIYEPFNPDEPELDELIVQNDPDDSTPF